MRRQVAHSRHRGRQRRHHNGAGNTPFNLPKNRVGLTHEAGSKNAFRDYEGFVTATPSGKHRKSKHAMRSCHSDGILPLCSSFGAEDPQGGSRD
jgi:hypothetical protein